MNLALWIATGLLALVALAGGISKTFLPKEKLDSHPASWTTGASAGFVKTLGVLELLAAVGLILPAALGIAPVLVPLAAVGLVLMMVGATITHLRRHEVQAIVVPLALLAMAALVAWGRLGPESFTA